MKKKLGFLLGLFGTVSVATFPLIAMERDFRDEFSNLNISSININDNNEEEYKKTCVMLKEHIGKNKDILTSSQGKDIIVFLGNTGAGKSTVINFLAGVSLKVDGKNKNILLENPEQKNSLSIGSGGISTTSLPQYVSVLLNNKETYMYDLPGFQDTRGVYTSIINAACIKKIIENAKTARFVFVAKEGEIESSRGKGIKEIAEIATKLFNGNSNIVTRSSILVLTKSDYSIADDLIGYVSEKVDISAGNTGGFNSWIKNKNIFPMEKGKLDNTQRQIIMNNIDKLEKAEINKEDINIGAIYSDREKNQTGNFLDRILKDIEPDIYADMQINNFNIHDITKIRNYLENDGDQKKTQMIDASPLPFLCPLISEDVYKDKMNGLDKRWNDAKTLLESKLRTREVDIEKIELEKQKIEQQRAHTSQLSSLQSTVSSYSNQISSLQSMVSSLQNQIKFTSVPSKPIVSSGPIMVMVPYGTDRIQVQKKGTKLVNMKRVIDPLKMTVIRRSTGRLKITYKV